LCVLRRARHNTQYARRNTIMICNCFTKKRLVLLICSLVAVYACIGCRSPQDYKVEADEQVYNIIDRKWQDDFGSKANYKISDAEPAPNDVEIKKTLPSDGVLTLPQAVALATANNRQYQLEKELLYTMALDLRLTRHEFESRFFSGATVGYGKEGNDEGVGSEADFGFDRLLADGTRIGTKVAVAWFEVLTGNVRGGLTSILSATLTKPLLRGSSREVVTENLTQAEQNTLYQIRSFNRFRKTFVVSVITEYYRTLELADAVKNAKQNCHTLEWLCEHVEKLAAVGRVPKEELQRIRQEKLQATDIYIQTEKSYRQALDDFKLWQLSLPVNIELRLDVNELEALRSAGPAKTSFSEPEAVEAALEQRLDLANSRDAVVDAERKVRVAADALRGELNLFAGVDATSSGSSRLTGADALDDDFTADRGRLNPMRRFRDEAAIGVDLELPLDRVAEQNIYRKALITLQQCKDTCLLLRYGRASSRRVLNAQRNLFQAQNEAVDALTDYNIATLNFYCAAGVLGVRPDGMWHH
jgi:hypothetical protein